MALSRSVMLDRAKARDARYDGRFLTGVRSTGIYCLPSCPAKNPKDDNVVHFRTPEAARAAGLRPCRRCRPDDFYRDHDPDLDVLRTVAGEVVASPGDFAGTCAMIERSGFKATKLTELFRAHFHTTPAQFLTAARIASAKRALLGTDRRVLDVGLDAGFESSSAFHVSFRRLTGLAPGDYRKLGAGDSFTLALPSDYRGDLALAYLGRDPHSTCERVKGSRLTRAIVSDGQCAVLSVELDARTARCRVESAQPLSAKTMARVHDVACRLLNVACDAGPFERAVSRKLGHGRLLRGRRGLRMPLTADPFEGLVWSIVGQQIHLAFAFKLRRVLCELAGTRAGDLVAHPTPEQLAGLSVGDLRERRFSGRKAEYVIETARLVAAGDLVLEPSQTEPAGAIGRRLLAVRGIGPWSANYLLMRGYGFQDCVPVGDAGLTAALQRFFALEARPGPERTEELMRPFAPWRSLAAFHLWRFLGDPE